MKTTHCSFAFLVFALSLATCAAAEKEVDLTARLNAAAGRASDTKHLLQYKFAPNETLRYRVEHLITVDTTIEGVRQRAKSRSQSTKAWKFGDARVDGSASFVHTVTDVDMWQQVDRRDAVRYNSQTDERPPLQYEKVAETVGVPLADVIVDSTGKILERRDKLPLASWGGQLLVPLPPEAVTVGETWYKGQEMAVRLQDGRVQRINTRQRYELLSVENGVAKISVATQILTPGIQDQPRVLVQIVQRLTSGVIEFDIERGLVVRQSLDLDQTVIGFNGPKSIMNYNGKLSEELILDEPSADVAAK